MTDLAALSFTIDSSQALTANQNLDRLQQTTDKTTASKKALSTQALDTQHSLGLLSDGTKQLTQQLEIVNTSFDTLMTRMKQTRAAFDGTLSSLKAWDDAANQVNALGRAFGTTAHGLDTYNQAASQLGFSSQQTAASLQRITLALENQTAVGAQLRKTMTEYGVSLRDLGVDQAEVALKRLQDAFSKTADTAKRSRDAQAILGTLDPDALASITSPNYIPIATRRDKEVSQATSLDNDRRYEAARLQADSLRQQNERYRDILQNVPGLNTSSFGLGLDPSQTRLTDAQIKAFRGVAPNDSAFLRDGTSTRTGRAALGEQILSTDIKPLQNRQGLTPQYDALGNVIGGATGVDEDTAEKRAQYAAQSARGNPGSATGLDRYGPIGSFFRRGFDGSNEVARTEIENEYSAANSNGVMDSISNFLKYRIAEPTKQAFGFRDAPFQRTKPNRLDALGAGFTLSGYGDNSLEAYQSANTAIASFGDQGRRASRRPEDGEAIGATGPDARGSEALAAFTDAYGADAPGALRQAMARQVQTRRNALRPGGRSVDQANLNGSLQDNVSLGDRGKATAFAAFAQSIGVDPADLTGQSLQDMLDPNKSAGGNINPQAVRDFIQSYKRNQATSNSQFTEQSNLQLSDTNQQGNVAGQSATAVQDLAAYQQAYNKALRETSDTEVAHTRAVAAQVQLDAERIKQGKELIANQERSNAVDADRVRAANSGGDLATRTAAGINAGIDADVRTRIQNGQLTSANSGAYAAGQARAQGIQAIGSAQDKVGSASDDVQTAQKLLSVADQRSATQQKLNRDLEVERSYSKELAQARVDDLKNQTDTVSKIEAAIQRTKELKDAQAELNQVAALYKLGRDSEQAGMDDYRISLLPRSQQARAREQQQVDRLARELQPSGMNGGEPGTRGAPAYPSNTSSDGFKWNNPTNLRFYPGQQGVQGSTNAVNPRNGFGIYDTPEAGIGAGLQQMLKDQDSGFNTIRSEITKRSPASDNNKTDKLISDMAALTGIKPDDKYDLRNPEVAKNFLTANIFLETGKRADPGLVERGIANGMTQRASTPGGLTNGRLTNDQVDAGVNAARDGVNSGFDLRNRARDNDLYGAAAVTSRSNSAALPYLAEGESAKATIARAGVVDDLDPNSQTRAILAIRAARESLNAQAVSDIAQTKLSTQANLAMADAYTKGSAAATDVTLKLKAEEEARTRGLDPLQKQLRLQQLRNEETTKEISLAQNNLLQSRDARAIGQVNVNAGPFASQLQIDRATAQATVEQQISKLTPQAQREVGNDLRVDASANQQLKETTQQVQIYRDSWKQAQDATFSALNSIVTGGSSAKQVLGDLAKSLSNILLQIAEKPLKDAGSSFFSSLLKLGGGIGGGTMGAAPVDILGAAGFAFEGGNRMMAAGGLLDRPTRFFSAGGQTNVAGEMGTEAVMPLKRMPNGDLGVSGGGGSGSSITVHAPITINGGGQNKDGTMDPAMAKALQAQLQESVRQAVVQGIAQEKRPGGSLY